MYMYMYINMWTCYICNCKYNFTVYQCTVVVNKKLNYRIPKGCIVDIIIKILARTSTTMYIKYMLVLRYVNFLLTATVLYVHVHVRTYTYMYMYTPMYIHVYMCVPLGGPIMLSQLLEVMAGTGRPGMATGRTGGGSGA